MNANTSSCKVSVIPVKSSVKLESSQRIFKKHSDFKCLEIPPSGSRVVPCRQTDMTMLTAALQNFANVPTAE